MDDQLHTFIKQAFDQGQTIEQVRSELVSVGWDESQVREAIHDVMSLPMINRGFAPVQPPPADTHSRNSQTQLQNGTKQSPTTFKQIKPITMSGGRIEDPRHPKIVRSFHPINAVIGAVVVLTGAGVIGGTVYYYLGQNGSETSIAKSAVQENPPVIATNIKTERYKNAKWKFLMDMPQAWSVKEYPDEVYGEEKRFAFGESRILPQTEFQQGNYAWLKIFPISDSENYSNFLQLGASIGKDEKVQLFRLDGKPGVRYNDFIAVEYNGFVYEFHLPVNDSGDGIITFTLESEEILRTFRFLE